MLSGMEQGFKSGMKGQRYGAPPPQARGDPYYYDDGYFGRRRQRGGIIHGILGGVMGAFEGQKNPVQDVRAGGRPQQQQQQQQQRQQGSMGQGENGSGYGGSPGAGAGAAQHVQESGVHQEVPATAGNEFPPPEYEPRK